MAKRQVIKTAYLPPRLPVIATIVAYLLYDNLQLTGIGAGVYITIASILIGSGWIASIYLLFTVTPSEPVLKQGE